MINVNARSLSIDKSDELLCVAQMNDVSCVCVTETWFKGFMSPESVGLAGYCCERNDREDRGGGGVACYVAASMVYTRLRYNEDDEHEVVWVRLRPQKLPRKYSCIIIACVYHPPKDMRNWSTWPRVIVPFWTKSGQICRPYMLTPLCYPNWDNLTTGWFYSSLQAILHWTRA